MSRHPSSFPSGRAVLLGLALACPVRAADPPPHTPALADDDAHAVAAPAPDGYDRAIGAARCRRFLEQLIAIDTTNGREPDDPLPDGNELATALWFADVWRDHLGEPGMVERHTPALADGEVFGDAAGRLLREWPDQGVEVHVLASGAGRANLVVRLRAPQPRERPVLVMGHMDVVGVRRDAWSTDPFVATERDGFLYGRGAIDCKGPLAAELTALLSLHARRESLVRDVVLLATAAEEGGPDVGVGLVVDQHRELLGDPEFALNEGGRIRVADGRVVSVNIQTTEKIPYNVRVTASGPSGHGSVPLPDNALARVARAAARLHDWRAPVRLNETTRLYFERQADLEPDEALRLAMRALVSSEPGSDGYRRASALLSARPEYGAVMRAGASLTMLEGGFRSNVIPGEGSALFNLRVLPDDDPRELLESMRRAVADDSVTLSLSRDPVSAPPVSSVDTALFRSMASAAEAMAPGVAVVPFMSTGATDGATLRAVGIPTYGILPIPMELADELRMHGDDERAPVAGLGWAAEYVYRVLAGVAFD